MLPSRSPADAPVPGGARRPCERVRPYFLFGDNQARKEKRRKLGAIFTQRYLLMETFFFVTFVPLVGDIFPLRTGECIPVSFERPPPYPPPEYRERENRTRHLFIRRYGHEGYYLPGVAVRLALGGTS